MLLEVFNEEENCWGDNPFNGSEEEITDDDVDDGDFSRGISGETFFSFSLLTNFS